ncbi:MAG: hypothetical protein IT445_15300 [Phycisphaeraceae bacterium]|nr:hypothetical protein [Phycisphaeraceae bacterium]
MRSSLCCSLVFFLFIGVGDASAAQEDEAPIQWSQPSTFDPAAPGLGLPRLPGCTHEILYNPAKNTPIRTIDGRTVEQGWYSHAPDLIPFADGVIAVWTNHLRDEGGAGQRQLARFGRFDPQVGKVAWADEIVEIAPSPVVMARRPESNNPDAIDCPYVRCRLEVIGGKLYVFGELSANDGWSNNVSYNHLQDRPIPEANYRDGRDRDAGFRYDIKRHLDYRYIQQWQVTGDRLEPASPIYRTAPLVERIEVTPGRFKPVVAVFPVYAEAASIDQAPPGIQQALHAEPDFRLHNVPKYAPGTSNLAADGSRGLAHQTQFQRPDGKWVVVRDHLVNGGCYYAAVKDNVDDNYPPAFRTNLFGDVQPEAGSLPDGRVWLIGNEKTRRNLYLTLSDDGIHFDRSWLLVDAAVQPLEGLGKGRNPEGPQYQAAIRLSDRLLVIYSIAKQQVGLTQIPLSALD